MRKLFALTATLALCAVPALGAAKPMAAGVHPPSFELAQAQAPGRPTTPAEKSKPAPSKPNKDPIVNRPPPPPGTPNFPPRPPNNPPLKNPLKK